MLGFNFVAIDELAAEVAVDLVEIHAVVAGDEGLHEFEVLAYFLDVACTAGIVAGRLDAAGQTVLAFETDYVVGLPAVEGDLLLFKLFDGLVGIYTDLCVALLGDFIRFP